MGFVQKYMPSFHRWTVVFFLGSDKKAVIRTPVREGMYIANIEGMYATVYFMLVSGAFLTGYALLIGCNDFHLGLLAAIPAFSNLPGLLSAYISERAKSRKRLILPAIAMSRNLWLPLVILMFLPFKATTKVWVFLVIYFTGALFAGMCTNLWQGWISDLVPEQIRGRFFGRRNRILNFASIVTLLLGAWILDTYKEMGWHRYGYVIIISIALGFAALAYYALKKQYEPPMHHPPRLHFWYNLMQPFKNREYMKVVRGFATLHFGLGLSAAFFSAYMLTDLHMTYIEISLFTIYSQVVGMFFNPFWGHIMDHTGLKPVLLFNLGLIIIIPVLWVTTMTFPSTMLWVVWTLVGIGWSGFNIAGFNLPFALSPKEGRTYYLSVLHISTGFVFFVTSVIAGIIAHRISNFEFTFGTLKIVHYHVLFAGSSLGRALSLLFFMRVKDIKDKGILYMIQFSSNLAYTKLTTATKVVLFPKERFRDQI